MSVPLDRLYNFLSDICNRNDLVIYRFYPHGSRNIADLLQLQTHNNSKLNTFQGRLCNLAAFCHDQEPLNFDLYAGFDDIDDLSKINSILVNQIGKDILTKYQDTLYKFMPTLNLKIVTQNLDWFTPSLLFHSEQRSKNLEKYQQYNYIGVYYWCHAVIARDWYRYAEHDTSLNSKNINTKDFLIYNRAWIGTREYRLKFTELLQQNELTEQCQTWFSPVDDGHDYRNHKFNNSDFKIFNYNLEQYFKPSKTTSSASADYCGEDYRSTNIEVVLETLFDDLRLHLTEKSLRPIACGQPFMLMATHGSLEYMRSYGFETFAPWIDETYDTIQQPIQRLTAVVKEMKRISELDQDQKLHLFTQLQTIAQRNKQKFFDSSWQKNIIEEFQRNFNQACDQFDRIVKYPI